MLGPRIPPGLINSCNIIIRSVRRLLQLKLYNMQFCHLNIFIAFYLHVLLTKFMIFYCWITVMNNYNNFNVTHKHYKFVFLKTISQLNDGCLVLFLDIILQVRNIYMHTEFFSSVGSRWGFCWQLVVSWVVLKLYFLSVSIATHFLC